MAQQNLEQLFRDHIAAFNAKDWNRYGAMMTDDSVYEEEATQRRLEGRAEIIKVLDEWKSAFPDLKGTIKEIVASGDRVVAELEWSGTHKGTLAGPMGRLPATNRSGKVPAVVVTTIENGKISSVHNYFDLITLLGQLGVKLQPQMGAGATP